MLLVTKSQKETFELGKGIARKLRGGEILGLEGDLGTGKTTLIKGVARGLGVKRAITSPTFVLMKVYKARIKGDNNAGKRGFFVHVDVYRVKDEQGLIEIGLEEYLGKKDTVAAIEWADKVRRLLRGKKVIWIKMGIGKKKENERIIKIGK